MPPCPAGQAEGTLLPVFPTTDRCGIVLLDSVSAVQEFFTPVLQRPLYLWAVYETHRPIGAGVAAAYSVVLGTAEKDGLMLYLDRDGAVIGYMGGCYSTPMLTIVGAKTLLPSQTQKPQPAPPGADDIMAPMRGEANGMRFWLRIATGEEPICDPKSDGCAGDDDFSRTVAGLIEICGRAGPDWQRNIPGYDPARDEAVLGPFEAACNTLAAARLALGKPRETEPWRQAAIAAKQLLAPPAN